MGSRNPMVLRGRRGSSLACNNSEEENMDRISRKRSLQAALGLAAACVLLAPVTFKSQFTGTAPPPLILGTAWYPEQWPESRWDADLALMQEAGIHMVRVGEFAWSRMEPGEGQYDL